MFFYSFLELQAGPREPARSRLIPKARDDLVGCSICGRNFAEDRIEKHQEICMKSQSKKRKTFDMAKKRLQGTDAETFALKPKRGGARVSKVSPQIIPSFSNYLTVLVLVSAIFTEISLTCKICAPMAIWSGCPFRSFQTSATTYLICSSCDACVNYLSYPLRNINQFHVTVLNTVRLG